MPRWDYRCQSCQQIHTLEFSSWHEATNRETRCPSCQGLLDRLPPAPAFRLVGGGFHQNDYPKKG